MKNQNLQVIRKFALAIVTASLITGCASQNMETPINSGRTDISQIQSKMRTQILSRFIEKEEPEYLSTKIVSKDDVEYVKAEETPELLAWRADINKTWGAIDDDKIDLLCEFMYQGLYDETNSFASYFVETRKKLAADGISIYSINNIRMREDNRDTIQFPTEEQASLLFVCSSQIVFKFPNGNLSKPQDSRVNLLYYIFNGKRQFTINFSSGG